MGSCTGMEDVCLLIWFQWCKSVSFKWSKQASFIQENKVSSSWSNQNPSEPACDCPPPPPPCSCSPWQGNWALTLSGAECWEVHRKRTLYNYVYTGKINCAFLILHCLLYTDGFYHWMLTKWIKLQVLLDLQESKRKDGRWGWGGGGGEGGWELACT